MPLDKSNDDLAVESHLTLWRERAFLNYKRKEITPREMSAMFQQDLHNAFFSIMDHDRNGALSEEEWTGCFTKLLGDNDPSLINWFVDKFHNYCNLNDKIYIDKDDFGLICTDLEFGYRFSALIAPKSRKVSTIDLITSLEIIASLSTDAKWLSWLKYQFTEAVKSGDRHNPQDCRVTFDDFNKNFNFKEAFLSQRLFNYLDTDKSGYLTLHEFINGLEVVVNGSDQEKMEFLFKVFDVDNDGRLDYTELRMLLKCCLEDSPSLDMEEAVDDLTTALFRNTDIDCSGDITIEELKEAFRKHDSLFKTLSVSTSVWIKPKFVTQRKRHHWYKRAKEVILNKRGILCFWTVYILINIATTITAYFNYMDKNGLIICARIFGNGLNFNCALVLGLVLRKHFTWLRSKGATSFLPLDEYIELHKIVGIVILVETLIHTTAHLVNLYYVCEQEKIDYWIALLTARLLIGFPTGVVVIGLLFIILVFTLSCVRKRGHFQLFYIFHLLSIPFLLIMLFHGLQFWKWILLPGFMYTVEKILRYRKVRSNKFGDTYISEATLLPSKVTHLVIRKPKKFHYQAGDYIFINIPAIAKYEWHPFSISSVPELQDTLWLHVRAVGNWTLKLNSFVRARLETKYSDESILRTSMRSRMSRLLSDVSAQHVKKVSWNTNNNANNLNNNNNNNTNIHKVSSYTSNVLFGGTTKQHTSSIESMKKLNNLNANNDNPQQALRKGILKTLSRDKSMNETTLTNHYDDFPTESTPKANDTTNGGNDKSMQANEIRFRKNSPSAVKGEQRDAVNETTSSAININLKEVALMSSNELEKFMQDLLDKNKTSNIDPEALNLDKSKQYEKKPINDAIVTIDMEQQQQQQQQKENELPQLCNAATNTTVVSIKPTEVVGADDEADLKKQVAKIHTGAEENDILGYLKMYQKTNRLCIQQMPTADQWSLKVYIDGPYGTPSRDIFDAEHVVLIAAGIGITPYASILQSIMQRFKKTKNICPSCDHMWEQEQQNIEESSIKKVDFIWVTRDQRSLEWFISMLSQMEIDQKKNNQNFLETHLYVTSARRQTDLKSIGLHMTLDVIYSEEDSRLIEGLKQRTHYGRPNWDSVFQQLIRKQEGKISVFFCGPPSLSDVLQNKCREYNLAYKKELF